MNEKLKKQEEQKLFDVLLLKDHTHEGELCRASATIKVNETDKNWLQAQNVIAPDGKTAV